MFEGSLVESRGLVVSATRKWTTVGSITVQCLLAGLVVAIPLLRPELLRIPAAPAPLIAPVFRPVQPVPVRVLNAAQTAMAMSIPVAAAATTLTMGHRLLPGIDTGHAEDVPAIGPIGPGMGFGTTEIAASGIGTGPAVSVVRAREAGPTRLSKGVTEGLLLAPIQPVYPAIARASRTQGTVVMEAVISTSGRIESLHAVSGPAMLRQSALDAVAQARYRPYLLNGEPTEVQTTVTVVFTLGG